MLLFLLFFCVSAVITSLIVHSVVTEFTPCLVVHRLLHGCLLEVK